MHRYILFIIPVTVLLIIITGVAFNYLTAQNVTSHDTKKYIINLTNGGNGSGATASAQNTQPSSAIKESENTDSIRSTPKTCNERQCKPIAIIFWFGYLIGV